MNIYRAVTQLEENGEAGALCTIISTEGSTPRHEGSKMLVFTDGGFIGTVGGGEVENRIIAEALASLKDGKISLLKYCGTYHTKVPPCGNRRGPCWKSSCPPCIMVGFLCYCER